MSGLMLKTIMWKSCFHSSNTPFGCDFFLLLKLPLILLFAEEHSWSTALCGTNTQHSLTPACFSLCFGPQQCMHSFTHSFLKKASMEHTLGVKHWAGSGIGRWLRHKFYTHVDVTKVLCHRIHPESYKNTAKTKREEEFSEWVRKGSTTDNWIGLWRRVTRQKKTVSNAWQRKVCESSYWRMRVLCKKGDKESNVYTIQMLHSHGREALDGGKGIEWHTDYFKLSSIYFKFILNLNEQLIRILNGDMR